MSTDPDTESDQQPGCLHPRERYDLFGHETAETEFANAWSSGKMHHAWLITGPRGVGKASFAWRAARRVLGAIAMKERGPLGSDPHDPVCQLFESQACPDLFVLRKPWNEKTKKWRGEIIVDEARKVQKFFEKSAGAGGWRACIVDSADDMNNNAANALLKTLEEPPARGILFLIAHSPGRLPATIRSRCRRLDLRAPSIERTTDWLTHSGGPQDMEQARMAAQMAHGAPGRALALSAAGGVSMAQDVEQLVSLGNKASDSETRAMAERVAAKNAEGLRSIFYECLTDSIRLRARQRAEAGADPSAWISSWKQINTLVQDADNIYLDAKQTALSALSLVREASRKQGV